jgi:predicted enzyme related to lactoylglutathione lyase
VDVAAHPSGSVCWIDIGCEDPAATARFYAAIFGWTYTEPDPSGYRVAMLDGRAVSGLGPAEDPGPPYWTVVVGVDDIYASVETAVTNGARIVVPPATAGHFGKGAVGLDRVGAPLSWWQPGTQTGMQVAGEHGTYAGIDLLTGLPEAAHAFYRNVFGWKPDGEHLAHDGTPVATVITATPPRPTHQPSLWLVTFAADDRRGHC